MFRSLILLSLLACGCSSVPLFSRHKFQEADARHPVMEVMCVWEAAEGRGLDNLPSRGFGGQVLFFASGHKEPVKVHGDVRIYVFDEEGVDGDSAKPIHQFDFPAEVWNTYLRPSNLGATYQIFIPYTRKGLNAAKCTLRVRFTPEGGLPLYSRMATIPLAGIEEPLPKRERSGIVTASAEGELEGSGVRTADWNELSSQRIVPKPIRPQTPGIPVQAAYDHTSDLSRLRQAAASATRDEESATGDTDNTQVEGDEFAN